MRLAALTALMFTTAMTMTACGGSGDDGDDGGDDGLSHGDDGGDDGGDDSSGDDSSGDDSSGDDSSSSGSSCQDIIACFGECTTDACFDACLEDGSSEGQNQVLDLLGCAEEHACETSECLSENCGSEINACAAKYGEPDPAGLIHHLETTPFARTWSAAFRAI